MIAVSVFLWSKITTSDIAIISGDENLAAAATATRAPVPTTRAGGSSTTVQPVISDTGPGDTWEHYHNLTTHISAQQAAYFHTTSDAYPQDKAINLAQGGEIYSVAERVGMVPGPNGCSDLLTHVTNYVTVVLHVGVVSYSAPASERVKSISSAISCIESRVKASSNSTGPSRYSTMLIQAKALGLWENNTILFGDYFAKGPGGVTNATDWAQAFTSLNTFINTNQFLNDPRSSVLMNVNKEVLARVYQLMNDSSVSNRYAQFGSCTNLVSLPAAYAIANTLQLSADQKAKFISPNNLYMQKYLGLGGKTDPRVDLCLDPGFVSNVPTTGLNIGIGTAMMTPSQIVNVSTSTIPTYSTYNIR